jgi:hypothetical protein
MATILVTTSLFSSITANMLHVSAIVKRIKIVYQSNYLLTKKCMKWMFNKLTSSTKGFKLLNLLVPCISILLLSFQRSKFSLIKNITSLLAKSDRKISFINLSFESKLLTWNYLSIFIYFFFPNVWKIFALKFRTHWYECRRINGK